MDLESINGTFINKTQLEPCRYVELKPNDTINFGMSTRDYILIKVDHEKPQN
jgi:smad nuclear-interacting protein 1